MAVACTHPAPLFTLADAAEILRITRTMHPREKAQWIWTHTDIRPTWREDLRAFALPSLTHAGVWHQLETVFVRNPNPKCCLPVPMTVCPCEARVECWHVWMHRFTDTAISNGAEWVA